MTSQLVWQLLLTVGVFTVLLCPVKADVQLSHLSTIYLPAAPEQKPAYDEGAVEQIAYDPVRKLIYAAGKEVYHVINATEPSNLVLEYTKYEAGLEFTDIEACGDFVFITAQNESDPLNGVLRMYKSYVKDGPEPVELVKSFTVGSLPDMLKVLEDCMTAVVAVEGEAFAHNGDLLDPEGQVAIVHFPDGAGMAKESSRVTRLGFQAFNDRYQELKPSGVRFVYTENNNTLSQDLEPEYVAVDAETNTAYVALQEANAIAEVDLATRTITRIRGLGYKQWGYLDASDRDDGARITYWPIRAWYLPDAIQFHQWQGRKLLFTANEGDSKEYITPDFDETTRGKDIAISDLGSDIPELVRSAIQDDSKLGRLKFSGIDGKNEAGKYSALYTYGGRSFSIWDVTSPGQDVSSPLAQVFDSGSQFEELVALHCPLLFGRDEDEVDGRSDSRGPEPESLTLAEIDGRLYIFIGLERPGIIMVYSLGRDVSRPRFETIYCDLIPTNTTKSLMDMFEDRELLAIDPDDIRFYPARESPTGRPVLILNGAATGTITLLDIQVTDNSLDDEAQDQDQDRNNNVNIPTCPDSGVIIDASLVMMCICLLLHIW